MGKQSSLERKQKLAALQRKRRAKLRSVAVERNLNVCIECGKFRALSVSLCKCRSTKSSCASYIVRDVDTSTSTSPAVVKHSSKINESLPLPYSRIEQFDNFYVAARAVVQGEEALTSAATLLDSQHAQQQLSQLASSSSSSSSSAASTRPVSKEMPETIKIPRTHHRYQTLRRSLVMDCKPPSDSSEIAEVKHSGIQNSDDVFVADSDQDDHDGTDSEIKNPSIVQERIRSNAFEFDQDNESPMGQLIRKTSLDLKSQIKCNRRLDYYH